MEAVRAYASLSLVSRVFVGMHDDVGRPPGTRIQIEYVVLKRLR